MIVEPTINTPEGWRRPDLIISKGGSATVCDVTVVSDGAALGTAHRQKTEYYDKPAIREWVNGETGIQCQIAFWSVTLNWRGVMAKESFEWLHRVGFGSRLCRVLSLIVLEEGYKMYLAWKRSAFWARRV